MSIISNFSVSHQMVSHPLVGKNIKIKRQYYIVLQYFVTKGTTNYQYTSLILEQYRDLFDLKCDEVKQNDKYIDKCISNILSKWWRRKYRFLFMCDLSLIMMDKDSTEQVQKMVYKHLSNRKCRSMDIITRILFENLEIPNNLKFTESFVCQYRKNQEFLNKPELRILVAGNMSSGKSTLINAIIGKPITKTTQGACTANLSYITNKPFEDNKINLLNSTLILNANYGELMNIKNENVSYIASYFNSVIDQNHRICLIDTPGVNSAINCNHAKITYNALKEEKYDKLIYVLNSNQLGTDDDIRYLQHIANNVPKDKIVFVLNKLDNFNVADDNISESIELVENDLMKMGFENPIICPISAYCALLIKMKKNGGILNEDEEDMYELYKKRFGKIEYDLSNLYNNNNLMVKNDELYNFALRCGLHNIENKLYGGLDL